MIELTNDLKRQALKEGFDLVGIAATGEAHTKKSLRDWLDAGMNGDMAYMKRNFEIRTDPGRLLKNCLSVIAVALSYHSAAPLSTEIADAEEKGWVSRYAWGRDYHRLMKKRLIRLGRWLDTREPGSSWRACVDTAPSLEREWASRAGLGWIGKNTMLLNRRLGSELFLGLLLTDLRLVPDEPSTSHCGRCTACLEACPTSAFPRPRVLDARRCIAYLTVEHRSEVDEDLQPLMGRHIAGCDICNEVCPFTRRAPTGIHPEFDPVEHRLAPNLKSLEDLDEEGWREWRRASPLGRIPYDVFRRTLKIVKRNLKSQSQP